MAVGFYERSGLRRLVVVTCAVRNEHPRFGWRTDRFRLPLPMRRGLVPLSFSLVEEL